MPPSATTGRRRPARRVVVLRALGLGDLLTAVPALRALAAAFPAHRRVLAAPASLAPLAMLSGAVDGVVDTGPLTPLGRELVDADVAVNLHGRGPESHRVLMGARPRRMIAFTHPEVPETFGCPDWHEEEHEVVRWCRLLRENGIPADPADLDLTRPAVTPAATDQATVIHPGAASPARRWPPERWARVAAREAAAGRPVVVTGGVNEVPLAREVARRAGLSEGAVVAGTTDLLALASVVGRARRLLCADTGVAHLATALRTPSVVLFGPVPPSRWGPPPERRWHRALWAGRVGDPHGDRPDPGLLRISVDDVLEALETLPDAKRDGRPGVGV